MTALQDMKYSHMQHGFENVHVSCAANACHPEFLHVISVTEIAQCVRECCELTILHYQPMEHNKYTL